MKPPRSGRVKIDERSVTGDHHRARQHGVRLVPSDGGLLPNLTVLRNILYTECVVERRPREHREKEVRHSTAIAYGLNDVLDRYPYEITVGRRRMAGLARALRADPSVVVLEDDLDAPTWAALLGAQKAGGRETHGLSGVAVVLVTSDLVRIQGLDAPALMFQGGDGGERVAGGEGVDG
ncbi:MAG: ATP-binding cassette domain-containing protein [Streptosporangiales bacterium]|nr:ATP-binding cassette domain-containing protein [Streptosporangiales bacterium]